MNISNLINNIHSSGYFGRIFHTLDYCLQKELADCESVLDLGCGPSSPLQHCKNIKRSVGVEVFEPYLEKSRSKKIHTEYIQKDLMELDFPENSFDSVIMIEVLEHLPENAGLEIIKKAKKWTKRKLIISSPNGFIDQKEMDGNPYQKHVSGWDVSKMRELGFRSRGLAGLKFIRQEVQNETMENDLLTSIKFKPRLIWFFITVLSQIFCYYFPSLAFELFSVYEKDK